MGSVEIVLALMVLVTVVAASAGRLSIPAPSLLVQAESLFNDATSLVLFQVAVCFAAAGARPGDREVPGCRPCAVRQPCRPGRAAARITWLP